MYVKMLTIHNYKSFWKSDGIPFEKGFNLIVGQNDSGKSALLEALQPGMSHKPHRSLLTAPESSSPAVPISATLKVCVLTGQEFVQHVSRMEYVGIPFEDGNQNVGVAQFHSICEHGCELLVTWHDQNVVAVTLNKPSSALSGAMAYFQNADWPHGFRLGAQIHGNMGGSCYARIANLFSEEIYAFKAERYAMGSSGAGGNRSLAANAANLPEVLNKLADDPATEQELLNHVKAIFPHITHISSTLEGGSAHIRIWTQPISSKRRDLAIPLADSGSGIGQVLAMLYVVVTADKPKVILIDEPQSFLHPGAVRKLFEILRSYSQHQYVITTHAPTGLDISDAANMLLVRRGVDQSTVVRLDPSSQQGANDFLSEVGARLSDVFGADNVLWVEGKTEEKCFPVLVRDVAKKMVRGTQILGVINTGDLEASFADRIIQIYQRLSAGPSVLPPAVAFLFDKEGRSEREQDDISRRGKGLVKWLPRRMYENYLIEVEAICELINGEDPTRETQLKSDEVANWLNQNGSNIEFFPKPSEPFEYGSQDWFEHVHAGKLLQKLFGELTSQRLRYDKVKHGEELTKMIVRNPSDAIRDLAHLIADCCA